MNNMNKDMRNMIDKVKNFKEYINEENQNNKLIIVNDTNSINRIKDNNKDLRFILNNDIFNDKNVYLKGGVSRIGLETYIYGYSNDLVRDIDYCFIGEYKDYKPVFYYNKFNTDVDYEGTSLDDYFKSRDVTINQVLLRPDILIFTRRAYRDFTEEKINPMTNILYSRMTSRVLLFCCRYGFTISDNIKIDSDQNEFDYLVCLLKAYELNLSNEYFSICKKYNITKSYSLSEWLFYLLSNVYNFNLFGRDKLIANDILMNDNRKELYEFYPDLKKEVDAINIDNEKDYIMYIKKKNRNNIKKNKELY